jgi:surface adhesion protein
MQDIGTFAWHLGEAESVSPKVASALPLATTITAFDPSAASSGGDVLDLRDLLQGESPTTLSQYLHFSTAGPDTVISISSSGAYGPGFDADKTDQMLTLADVDLRAVFALPGATDAQLIQELLNRGKLLTDGQG